jgi:ubiquitin-protein ligase
MANLMSPKRLRKELLMLQREPVPLAVALPLDSNILEWRFLIEGIGPYAGEMLKLRMSALFTG